MLILSNKVNKMQPGKKNQTLHPTTYIKKTYYNKSAWVGNTPATAYLCKFALKIPNQKKESLPVTTPMWLNPQWAKPLGWGPFLFSFVPVRTFETVWTSSPGDISPGGWPAVVLGKAPAMIPIRSHINSKRPLYLYQPFISALWQAFRKSDWDAQGRLCGWGGAENSLGQCTWSLSPPVSGDGHYCPADLLPGSKQITFSSTSPGCWGFSSFSSDLSFLLLGARLWRHEHFLFIVFFFFWGVSLTRWWTY